MRRMRLRCIAPSLDADHPGSGCQRKLDDSRIAKVRRRVQSPVISGQIVIAIAPGGLGFVEMSNIDASPAVQALNGAEFEQLSTEGGVADSNLVPDRRCHANASPRQKVSMRPLGALAH